MTTPRNVEFQKQIASAIVKCGFLRNYSLLANFLEILANSMGDGNSLSRIQWVKKHARPSFEALCMMYLVSYSKPFNKHLRFRESGGRMPWTKVRELCERQIIGPLNEETVHLMSMMTISPSVTMQENMLKITQAIGQIELEKPTVIQGVADFEEPEKPTNDNQSTFATGTP